MMVIGLTGGIGSGKTTVANEFAKLGIPVYFADEEAKRLMNGDEDVKKAIITLFGKEAYKGKTLNKTLVAQKVFNDKTLLQKLNAIVHPAVRKHFNTWVEKQHSPYVIQEAAIIFENGSNALYNAIVLVTAPKDVRISRVQQRDGFSKEQVEARMRNQWEDEKKSKYAHYILENIDLTKTKKQINAIHAHLLKISGGV